MKFTRNIKLASVATVAVVGVTGATIFGMAKVNAEESGATFPPLVQRLVEKFNLDTTEVAQVVDQYHTEKVAEREAKMADRLDQAVTDGKITEAQKVLILQKQTEIKSKMDEYKGLTPDERKTKMDALREEMRIWAENNGIELPFPGMGFGRGRMMHRMGMGEIHERVGYGSEGI